MVRSLNKEVVNKNKYNTSISNRSTLFNEVQNFVETSLNSYKKSYGQH